MIKDFYEKVLPSEGKYICCTTDPRKGRAYKAEVFDTLEEFLNRINNFETKYNSYFATANFSGADRLTSFTISKKCFYIDIDVGEEKVEQNKKYSSKKEAKKRLDLFLEKTKFPEPIIVDSGGGYHVYWPLKENIEIDKWYEISNKIQLFCHGNQSTSEPVIILADPAVTTMKAGLLRCPDTYNNKPERLVEGKPPKVTIISNTNNLYDLSLFEDILSHIEIKSDNKEYTPPAEIVKEIKGLNHYTYNFKELVLKSFEDGKGCQQIRYSLENSKTLPEPQWYMILKWARQCEDWESAIHMVSEDHPSYNYDTTIKKAQQKSSAYSTCTQADKISPDICGSCSYYSKISSPLTLVKKIKQFSLTKSAGVDEEKPIEAQVSNKKTFIGIKDEDYYRHAPMPDMLSEDTLPIFFYRDEKNKLFYGKKTKTKNGFDKVSKLLLFNEELYPVRRIKGKTGDGVIFRVRSLGKAYETPKDIIVWQNDVHSQDKIQENLLSCLSIDTPDIRILMQYLNKWGHYLKSEYSTYDLRNQFGWHSDKDDKNEEVRDFKEFIIGEKCITPGEVRNAILAEYPKEIAGFYSSAGTLKEWTECINRLSEPGYELIAFALFAGMGSPLMVFTPENGAAISFSGQSGVGKSGSLKVAASVWGSPDNTVLQQATTNALHQRFLTLKNLPLCIDEADKQNSEELSKIVMNSASGKGKRRLHASTDTERTTLSIANGLTLVACNTPVLQLIKSVKNSAEGETQRVSELPFHKPEQFAEKGEKATKLIFNPIRYNYGLAGIELIKAYFKEGFEDGEDSKVYAEINKWENLFIKEYGKESESRFRKHTIGISFAAASIAIKHNIINFSEADLHRIFKYVIKLLLDSKANEAKDSDYSTVVGDFLAQYYGRMIVMSEENVSSTIPKDSVVGRTEIYSGLHWISSIIFDTYLSSRNLNKNLVLDYLTKTNRLICHGKTKTSKKRLFAGINAVAQKKEGSNVFCYKLKIDEK